MREIESPFQLEIEGNIIQVTEHDLKGKRVFHLNFNGWKKPLIITVALTRSDEKFWTSIPEGRQKEAEQVGKLIAAHIRNKRR